MAAISKKQLLVLFHKGKLKTLLTCLQEIMEVIESIDLRDRISLFSSQYFRSEADRIKGTIRDEDYLISMAKLSNGLQQILNELPEDTWHTLFDWETMAAKESVLNTRKNLSFFGRGLGAAIIIGILSYFANLIGWVDFAAWERQSTALQLTVFVHGPKSKTEIVLQNTGKVIADFGNDRRIGQVGVDGRTNFGEIPASFLNKEIALGVEAEGFDPIETGKKYIFTGEPIYFAIKQDDLLGLIRGMVGDKKGSPIADAIVMINQDTTTTTDSLGKFCLLLPEHMRVKDYKGSYHLKVSKNGKIKEEYYYPRSEPIEIRLD
ncbi:MAG: hypothetical protein Q8K92_11530 [Leadbetterella sp.]|nr:hypothetical protein [Leadbetterella sp.]